MGVSNHILIALKAYSMTPKDILLYKQMRVPCSPSEKLLLAADDSSHRDN